MEEFEQVNFIMPKNQSNAIKVIGVGGGGSNAVNHMYSQGIEGVDFVICNTDVQALENSEVPTKIQLGVSLTEGLGAGANPEVGKDSAIESEAELKKMLGGNTKMVFINAGMGGGTGTGAAPVIAKLSKEMNLLTIGVVTIPFTFEGGNRVEQAQKGIEELRKHVDSLVVINNNKLREVYGNLGFKAGFSKADEVLATASRGIAEVITHHYTQNIDLRDAKTVLANSGTAIMGSSKASGENRAEDAIKRALDSPLLNDNKIEGAKNVLLLIVSGSDEITIDEIGEINDYIQAEAKTNVNIIMGVGEDETLGDAIAVTIIATGFHKDQQHEIINTEEKKVIHVLGDEQEVTFDLSEKDENFSTAKPIQQNLKETPKKIIYTLDAIEEEVELISTSELIKNMDVVYDEISYEHVDDFIITSAVKDIEVTYEEIKPDSDQVAMTFDLNLDTEKPIKSNLNDIEVVGHQVVNSDLQKEERVYFDLDDYEKLEERLHNAKSSDKVVVEEPVAEEMKISMRSTGLEDSIESTTPTNETQDISPLHSTITELKETSQYRKDKLTKFNHVFRNNVTKNVDEIEREPAYKRMGVELSEVTPSSESIASKTVLSVDENDDLQLRSSNSYLHDNVD